MKHRNSPDLVIFVLLLAVACVALAVPVALLDPRWLLPPAVLVAVAAVLLAFNLRWLRRFINQNLSGRAFESSRMQYSLAELPVPVILLEEGRVAWYNPYFRDEVLGGKTLSARLSAGCCRGLILRSVRGPTARTLRQTAAGSPPTPARCAAGRAGRSST